MPKLSSARLGKVDARPMAYPQAGLKADLQSHMRNLQQQPSKIRACLQAPIVRYAA